MGRDIRIKMCGLRTAEDVAAAADAGAHYVGFVFFERSPRNVTLAEARDMALATPEGIAKVALVVDAGDAALDALMADVPLDMLQLHGHESPARVTEIKTRYGLPVMKAIGIAEAPDLGQIALYSGVADQLLIDAKPPKGAALPGGNALAFDWSLISGRRWTRPWMLAGGLTPDNVAEAIRRTGAQQLDVSSGIESAPGVKNPDLMRAFAAAARS
ncbi:phosphoribosylanthranilate isomerase [Roseovarius nanhaiticus]|uniref:N-(5'-phosphoribosyl)anthranilate isomerase n=1 Tax=Roseovarius nanhaiticus TaxID=573024 RepID=A0A1N7FWL6_9RHOB|nr:phosphoribosylanthranilate isomerase [Roseovarius nanhaiticus]SEK43496.1 phosphoribosylanthranilate isomerase [Roseovarius nanhaiticus]SIS04720.1 phosphoribosylanthranilate isomerase [Roseovarius nanhaiticus]